MSLWNTFLLLFFTLSLGNAPSLAHQGATGVVKERMILMKEIRDDMKIMKRMSAGKAPYDAIKFNNHFLSMKTNSQEILNLFPEGSLQHPTEAKPNIWKNWNEFERTAQQLTIEIDILEQYLSSNDLGIIGPQLKKVGKSCLSCHKKYRKKKR